MVEESILGKAIDIVFNLITKFLVYVLKLYSPIKISPKKILRQGNIEWNDILSIKIENRLNNELYDVRLIGISKDIFSINIISDSSPKGKTMQYMNINTNHLVVCGQDRRTNNHWWLFRIHKLGPREVLSLNVKAQNKEDIFFHLSGYSKREIPIKERKDGAVAIPFQIGKLPKIK
ncbi:MAG: hypothetical protein ACKKMO_01025 [Candidatus Nealsonbacteria bacterium]